MKIKEIFKKLLIITLTAGITVNSIPLLSYAAIISQPGTEMAVTMEETESTTGSETEEETAPEENGAEEGTPPEENGAEEGTPPEENDAEEEMPTGEDTLSEEALLKTSESSEESTLREEEIKTLTTDAKEALKELLESRYVMALVYLCDSYPVKAESDLESGTVAELKSGHTVLIQDMEADLQTGILWYQVSFGVDDCEYTGYIAREYLACSDEKFLAWEESYAWPIRKLLAENSTRLATYNDDLVTYASDVSQFPSSYQVALQSLKDSHPNWTFVKFETGLDWNTVVDAEMEGERSLVYYTNNDAWKNGKFSSQWYYASRAAVEYCLDPRNGLTESRIFQFEQLTFNSSYHLVSAIQNVLRNSFMSGTVPQDSMSYAQAFYNIGKSRGISPFHLASRVLQEQGVNGGSPLISGTYPGYTGLYNYFNVGASGSTDKAVIESGLQYAKDHGWTTPYLSLCGGAETIGNNYILKGQDTLYLQKFDVESAYNGLYWHQYMQNIQAPTTESATIRSLYKQSGSLDSTFVFKIPVYHNMPKAACAEPSSQSVSVASSSLSMKGGMQVNLDYTITNMTSSDNTIQCVPEKEGIVSIGKVTREVSGSAASGIIEITALKPGTTELVITAEGGGRAVCKIAVSVDAVTLSEKTLTMNACSFDGTIESEEAEVSYTIENAKSTAKNLLIDNPTLLQAEMTEQDSDTEKDRMTGKIKLKALAPGKTKITLESAYGGTASFEVTIVRLPEEIVMDSEITLYTGNSKVVQINVLPEDTENKNVILTSEDETVATVNSSTGRITGTGCGTTKVTAVSGEKSLSGNPVTATCTVVVRPSVSHIEMASEDVELLLDGEVAESFALDGKIYLKTNMKGDEILQQDTDDRLYDITYQTSDEGIVKVDEKGLVTAVGIGNAYVTATVSNVASGEKVKTAKCRVSVVPEKKTETTIPDDDYIQPERIKIVKAGTDQEASEKAYELKTGGYLDLDYEVLPENADVESVSFTCSNPSTAQVSVISEGAGKGTVRITAGTKGNAVITAVTDTGLEKKINLIVEKGNQVEEVLLDRESVVLYVNGTDSTADGAEENAFSSAVCLTVFPESNAESGIAYQWFSTDEKVAVVDSDGKVTAVSPGEAVIIAQDMGGSGKYAKCTVKVERYLEELETNVDALRMQPGKKVTLKTMLTPSDVTCTDLKWESSEEKTATVSDQGVVSVARTAAEGETALITVTDTLTGLRKEIPLTVTALSCEKVTLSGEGEPVSAAVLYQNGDEKEKNLLIRAEGVDAEKEKLEDLSFYAVSSNEKVAVVQQNRNENREYDGTFRITAKGKGSATVKIYAADGSGKYASVKVTVKTHAESVVLQKEALYLAAGKSGTLSAAVTPADANDKTVIWKFKDDIEVEGFTLNPATGKVTVAKNAEPGAEAEFVAVAGDGMAEVSEFCTVTVIGTKVNSLKLNTSSVVMTGKDVAEIEPVKLTATVTPANADAKAARLLCESSNEAVVTVEQNLDQNDEFDGTFSLTPAGYGTAVITIRTMDNSKKATCKVFVSALEKSYRISAVTASYNMQSYALDVNSSCDLRIKDQFGTVLDNRLFTFTSSRPDMVVVDQDGTVTPNRSYEPVKNGKVVITAALTGDPYNRKVKFIINVLAKEQAETIEITAFGIRQDDNLIDPENPESLIVKYPADAIAFQAKAMNVYGEDLDTGLKWSVSDPSAAAVAVDNDTGKATVTIKKAGSFSLTCTANDTFKASRTVRVTATDARPVLVQSRITLNKQGNRDELSFVQGESIQLIANRYAAIESVSVKEVKKGKEEVPAYDFMIRDLGDGTYAVALTSDSLQNLKTGAYQAHLLVETEEVSEIGLTGGGGKLSHELPLTINVVDLKPKVSVKTASINRQDLANPEAELSITAPDEVEDISLLQNQSNRFDEIFEVRRENGKFFIGLKDFSGYEANSISGKLSVTVKGYQPVTVNLKVNTPLQKEQIACTEIPSMDVSTGTGQNISFYNKTTKEKLVNYRIVQVPENAQLKVADEKNADGTLTLSANPDVKYTNGKTVSFTIKVMALSGDGADLWALPADVKISVKTYTKTPSVSLKDQALTLNLQAASEKAQTDIASDRGNVRIADDEEWQISCFDSKTKEYTVVKRPGEKSEDIAGDIIFSYNRQSGVLTAVIREGAKISAGTYKYRITAILEEYSKVSRDITVTVIDKPVTAKIRIKGKLDLLTRSNSTLQGTVSLSNTKAKVRSFVLMNQDAFYSSWLSDDTLRIRLREGVPMTAGKKTVPVKIVLQGGTVLYGQVSFTVSQSTPKVAVPKEKTIYKAANNTTVMYDMNTQIPSGYEFSRITLATVPAGIGATVKDGKIFVYLTDRSLKPGTYSLKINLYFKGAQYEQGSEFGKAVQKTIKVKACE